MKTSKIGPFRNFFGDVLVGTLYEKGLAPSFFWQYQDFEWPSLTYRALWTAKTYEITSDKLLQIILKTHYLQKLGKL